MTVLLIVLLMIAAGVFWWEGNKRQIAQVLLGSAEVDDDHAVTKHQQVAALKTVGITLPPEQEQSLLLHSDPEQSLFYAR